MSGLTADVLCLRMATTGTDGEGPRRESGA